MEVSRQAHPGCLPNPPVGCVLVRSGQVIATGYTHEPGKHHAEADALSKVQGPLSDVRAYVTLEPCSFIGRTPSCARALIASGVGVVYVAMLDPDPRNSGTGVQMLRDAGTIVEVGLGEDLARPYLTPFLSGASPADSTPTPILGPGPSRT